MAVSPLKLVRDYFGMTLQEMKAEWSQGGLTAAEKDAIVKGITDGTETY
jgi:hypothetical protein